MIAEVVLPVPMDRVFDYQISDHMAADVKVGMRVEIPFGRRWRMVGIVQRLKEQGDVSELRTIRGVLDPVPMLDESDFELARWMSRQTLSSIGEAVFAMLPLREKMRLKDGEPRRSERSEEDSMEKDRVLPAILLSSEHAAVGAIASALDQSVSRVFLLLNDVGIGRRRVYMHAADAALRRGRAILILTPEIGMVQGMKKDLERCFGRIVTAWHGGMKGTERVEAYARILSGQAKVVVGPRSALFCGLNPGLIVLDDEEDPSYKSDKKPRFHAREAAVQMAQSRNAVVILGSASPSLEAYHAAQSGIFSLLSLTREEGMPPPFRVTLIQSKPAPRRGILSETLRLGIEARVARGEKSVVYLNRRGLGSALWCVDCGWIARCPDCGVAFAVHAGEKCGPPGGTSRPWLPAGRPARGEDKKTNSDSLLCHACSRRAPFPRRCASCKGRLLKPVGAGTQKVVSVLEKLFPDARVARVDLDAPRRTPFPHSAGSEANGREGPDIVVGTRMAAQAAGGPSFSLIGILDADQVLLRPDFRASERAFQAVIQAVERTAAYGDISADSSVRDVVIQAAHVESDTLRRAAALDYEGFAREELAFRRELGYPPFARMIQILLSGRSESKVSGEAARLRAMLDRILPKETICLGPAPAARPKKAGQSYWQILVKFKEENVLDRLKALTPGSAGGFSPARDVRMTVIVDPVEMR